MGLLHTTTPDGRIRRWTLKEVVQGKPLGHPSHAMFIHFPVAFYIGALGLDVLSRLGRFPAAPLAATWLLIGAFAGTVPAVVTGLVDWWGMVRGSRKRRWATRHLLIQLGAFAIFAADFATRWADRHRARAPWWWIAIEAAGVVVLVVGQWFGGVLVYEMGMRVSTGKRAEAAGKREPDRASS